MSLQLGAIPRLCADYFINVSKRNFSAVSLLRLESNVTRTLRGEALWHPLFTLKNADQTLTGKKIGIVAAEAELSTSRPRQEVKNLARLCFVLPVFNQVGH